MSKFTQGPWFARHTSGAGWGIFADLRPNLREKYSSNFPMFENYDFNPPKYPISNETWIQFPTKQWKEMQEANAHLMSAAPHLLESLMGLVDLVTTNMPVYSESQYILNARYAISKALGEK